MGGGEGGGREVFLFWGLLHQTGSLSSTHAAVPLKAIPLLLDNARNDFRLAEADDAKLTCY